MPQREKNVSCQRSSAFFRFIFFIFYKKTEKNMLRVFLVDSLKRILYLYVLSIGKWLSLVEHSVRDAGVAGSNPVFPTISPTQRPVLFQNRPFLSFPLNCDCSRKQGIPRQKNIFPKYSPITMNDSRSGVSGQFSRFSVSVSMRFQFTS